MLHNASKRLGIATCQPLQLAYGADYVSGDVVEQDQAEIHKIADTEQEAWLEHHGVTAEPLAAAAAGEDADQLAQFVQEHQADLMVAGAYGHSRLREWVLGGVTHDLLLSAGCCSLVSH